MKPADEQFQQAFRKFGHLKFKYGEIDCVVFVALVLKEISGIDYMKSFQYKSEAQAYSIIKASGGFIALVQSVLGPCISSPGHCSPVVCRDDANGYFMGIHINGLVVCKTKFGLNQVSADTIQRSWKCPALSTQ